MKLDQQVEKEMEVLLDEIPNVTSSSSSSSDHHHSRQTPANGTLLDLLLLDSQRRSVLEEAEREAYNHALHQYWWLNRDFSQLSLASRQYPNNGVCANQMGFPGVGNGLRPPPSLPRRSPRDVAGFVPSVNRDPVAPPGFVRSEQNWGGLDNFVLNRVFSRMYCSSPEFNGRGVGGMFADGWAPRSPVSPARVPRYIEPFVCGDGLIIPSRAVPYGGNNNNGYFVKERRKSPNLGGMPVVNRGGVYRTSPSKSPVLPLNRHSLYYLAKDQDGCRFLQEKFDEGKHEVDRIFSGVIDHAAELMVNPFGNYLMQKLLDVCSEEQRMTIILVLTEDPVELVKISLNIHGTRAVQKLIETLKTRRQISLVVSALQPGFLDLINDLNGNHVVKQCLETLSAEDNKFIFDVAAKHCVNIATYRHGCVVLQHCIHHSTGKHRANLVAEISSNGLFLAQDAFGNYVVQYLIELKIPSATEKFVSQFKGNYVNLSMQKFSSNVVEKCLRFFWDNDRDRIIIELLSVSHFEHLLQDPYANYVIQTALAQSKGRHRNKLVEAILPHAKVLRTSPYSKKILSRTLSHK